jgi:ATP-dependent Clp protease protease subunit
VGKMKRKFWNWVKNERERTLFLNGEISDETWYGDEVNPKLFKQELNLEDGDITVWINSPGGDVFAASQIYNMLMDYKGKVTVKIDGIAASAASVIAMAGEEVLISPTGLIMIHNPMTIAFGDTEEMKKAIQMLSEVKESIINAYEIKTGLSRVKLSNLMDAETWFNAKKAVDLGFADKILFSDGMDNSLAIESISFSNIAVVNSLLSKIPKKERKQDGIPIENLDKRLNLLKI